MIKGTIGVAGTIYRAVADQWLRTRPLLTVIAAGALVIVLTSQLRAGIALAILAGEPSAAVAVLLAHVATETSTGLLAGTARAVVAAGAFVERRAGGRWIGTALQRGQIALEARIAVAGLLARRIAVGTGKIGHAHLGLQIAMRAAFTFMKSAGAGASDLGLGFAVTVGLTHEFLRAEIAMGAVELLTAMGGRIALVGERALLIGVAGEWA